MAGQTTLGPSHVCPRCGEWWDVEQDKHGTWFVAVHDNESPLSAKVWAEEADEPVCPEDSCSLDTFKIEFT